MRFRYREADNETAKSKTEVIKKGIIKGRAVSGGFLIMVVDEESIVSEKIQCLNGTLCNRAEKDIIEVIE